MSFTELTKLHWLLSNGHFSVISERALVVVPCSLRELVLKGCHAISIARHMGIGATKKRICSRFTWHGIM